MTPALKKILGTIIDQKIQEGNLSRRQFQKAYVTHIITFLFFFFNQSKGMDKCSTSEMNKDMQIQSTEMFMAQPSE